MKKIFREIFEQIGGSDLDHFIKHILLSAH